MQKIISLFKRDYEGTRLVYDEVVPGAEWVQDGEGTATRKWDGTCCMVRDGVLYKRYTLKKGRTAPEQFEPATEVNEHTGKQEGWLPVNEDNPADQYHRAAFNPSGTYGLPDGTYELVGPKVQGGAENIFGEQHVLALHGGFGVDAPRDYEGLKMFLDGGGIEGVVWHHPDGRMVKIKARDFGVTR